MEELGKLVAQLLEETGLTEDELAQIANWKEPMPDLSRFEHKKAASGDSAPRG